jgi:hypothetical protein
MKRLNPLSRSGWLLAGVLVALVVVPAGAVAATIGVTELAGSNGQRADVTQAGQLDATEAPPSSFVTRLGGVDLTSASQSECVTFPVVSAAKAVVIRQFTVTAYSVPGTLGSVLLYEGPACQPSDVIDQLSYTTPGITSLPIDPGVALPEGGTISVNVLGLGVLVAFLGYTVPAGDVPAYTSTGTVSVNQARARTMACKARPTQAPATVPLMRMNCRSGPSSSSSWLDVCVASHRWMVPVTRPASSSWN